MLQLREITLADRNLINDFFDRFPPVISEHTFTNLFIWRRSRPIWVAEELDSLLFLVNPEHWMGSGKILFGPPAGPATLPEVMEVFKDEIGGCIRTPHDLVADFRETGTKISADRPNHDYVYKVSDLASLSGRKFMKKRNHIKQCRKKYRLEFEVITDANIKECLNMQHKWCEARECELEAGLFGEYQAIQDVFQYYWQFERLTGGAIRVDGDISAFAIAEKLTPDTAVWHFEKALPGFHGLAQTMNQMFAQHCLSDFEFVNREQDLGIKGLRRAKKSYHPDHMVEKSIILWG